MIRPFITTLLIIACCARAFPQCITGVQGRDRILAIEQDNVSTDAAKIATLVSLQQLFDRCGLARDSVYAHLLHRMGALEYKSGKLNEAIKHTTAAAGINDSGKKGASATAAIKNHFNLGVIYKSLAYYTKAMWHFDHCIVAGRTSKEEVTINLVQNSRLNKGNIFYFIGDFQQDIDEMTLALQLVKPRSAVIVGYLNERAQAYTGARQFAKALNDIGEALKLTDTADFSALANMNSLKGSIYEAGGEYARSLACYTTAIAMREKSADPSHVAGDYLNAGNLLRAQGSHARSSQFYNTAIRVARQYGNVLMTAKAVNNMATNHFRMKQYAAALNEYHKALLLIVPIGNTSGPLQNPGYQQCKQTGDNVFLYQLLSNKAECLLHLYKQNQDGQFLRASLSTALLTDSVITALRHEQTGEQSKLYWRNDTRDVFSNAIEACYLDNNPALAFYFMEKSKAVLLNDKLNELGASVNLPPAEAEKEQALHISVVLQQQQLSGLADSAPAFKTKQRQLLEARENLERYLAQLETAYPRYFQYKYADAVPQLATLQQYLAANRQGFVHYFMDDAAIYMLGITASSAKISKVTKAHYGLTLQRFLRVCANPDSLNSHYAVFTRLAGDIYQTLFLPLGMPKGRVVISNDNGFIPFEALTTDAAGRHFLVYDYGFSYVYSARLLLKAYHNAPGQGHFLGIAPENYAPYLDVLPLQQSVASLAASAEPYSGARLLTNREASRRNFLRLMSNYTIVNIFSHASADTSYREPLLYMADSMIRLSELQFLRNPATRLIVLSACETGIGKNETGEGMYSLARGFAAAGIPAAAATLWKADEQATYAITRLFHRHIASGMRADDALQQARLAYMQEGGSKNRLPYFWASLILTGNAGPVTLPDPPGIAAPGTAMIVLLVCGIGAVIFMQRSKRDRNNSARKGARSNRLM